VARINPIKLKQDADAHEKAGRPEKAIELLKQIVAENPRDWTTINKIGDLYAKANDIKAANDEFAKVAAFYSKDGFYLKAIAVWKKINRNDPTRLDAYENLGELYAKQGLAAEAKTSFNVAYDECVKRGKLRDAGEVLKKMAELDPSDLNTRTRLAKLYSREGKQDKAAGEYVAVADELVKRGKRQEALAVLQEALKGGARSPRLLAEVAQVHLVQKDFKTALPYLEEARKGAKDDRDVALRTAEAYLGVGRAPDARKVLEEILRKDPGDGDARVLLGRVLLSAGQLDQAFDQVKTAVDQLVERRQVDRAIALLQPIAQQDPPHIPTLAKLVELYRLSRNETMVVQTYSQMVEAYLRREEMEKAASILELLVQLEPHNEQHRSKLDWIRKQGVEPAPASWLPELGEAAVSPPVAAGPGSGPSIQLSGPLAPDEQEFVDEHLSEGRVFRKYGLVDKARDQFEAVLGRFADNLDARRELSEIHKERGELQKLAEQQRAIAQILRLQGDEGGAKAAEAAANEAAPAPAPPPPLLPPAPPLLPPAPPLLPPAPPLLPPAPRRRPLLRPPRSRKPSSPPSPSRRSTSRSLSRDRRRRRPSRSPCSTRSSSSSRWSRPPPSLRRRSRSSTRATSARRVGSCATSSSTLSLRPPNPSRTSISGRCPPPPSHPPVAASFPRPPPPPSP